MTLSIHPTSALLNFNGAITRRFFYFFKVPDNWRRVGSLGIRLLPLRKTRFCYARLCVLRPGNPEDDIC